MNGKSVFTIMLITLAVSLLTGGTAEAANVLMVTISGGYNGDGANINQTLINAGATTTYVLLNTDGQVAAELAAGTYDQIWVYDLSTAADNYPTDYAAIADWYNNGTANEIICDGRIISSYWSGRWTGEGQNLTENYLYNLDIRGGGLVLGTDHAPYQPGINEINALIGIEPFVGSFNLSTIPVDTANPLMNTPNDLGETLFDDSSPGQTPYGMQPNGQILYTVAWHSNNHDTPGISSTIEGEIGFHVTITSPADGSVFASGDMIDLAAEVTGGDAPFGFEWSYNGGTLLGSGQTLQVAANDLPAGQVTITVLAHDALDRSDDDSIMITIGNELPVCDAGGAYQGDAGVPLQFDGTGSYDPDGEIVSWDWDFGDGNTGTGPMPTHIYEQDGTYMVTLCVTDDDGDQSCCYPEGQTVPTEKQSWGTVKAIYR